MYMRLEKRSKTSLIALVRESIWTMPFQWSDLVESQVMDALGVSLFSQNHNYIEKLKLGEFVKMTLL